MVFIFIVIFFFNIIIKYIKTKRNKTSMADKDKMGTICFGAGAVIVIVVIIGLSIFFANKDNMTRTDITACRANQIRHQWKDPLSGNIMFGCKNKARGRKENYSGGGGPRACNVNQQEQIRGLPNGAGLLACADKPRSTTSKVVNGTESFVNVGAVPGYNCTFKETSSGVNSMFGPQYTCMPVKVNVASQSAKENYTVRRANFAGTNYRSKNMFVPSRSRVNNFMGTNYRRKENLSASGGGTTKQPLATNRHRSCGTNERTVFVARGPRGDLVPTCEKIGS
jgi:hypothetical protein